MNRIEYAILPGNAECHLIMHGQQTLGLLWLQTGSAHPVPPVQPVTKKDPFRASCFLSLPYNSNPQQILYAL